MKTLKFTLLMLALLFSLSARNSFSQNNHVLLEYCTGTWCPWCPCGDNIAHNIQTIHPNTLILSYHGPHFYGGDPFTDFNGWNIIPLMGFNAYPMGVVGRMTGIIDRSAWSGQVNVQEGNIQPGVSITINKTYNPGTRTISATINTTPLQNLSGNYYINYVLTESGLIYYQAGNGSCPGGSNWVHDWVMRDMINSATGALLHSGSWNIGQTETRTLNYTINNAWIADNCTFAVFVYLQSGSLSFDSHVQQTAKEPATLTGIKNENETPLEYSLSQNYPNPFNPVTNIKFTLPKDGYVSFKIYDVIGNEAGVFVDGFIKAGTYNAEFDGSNYASGVYFYKLTAGDFSETKKMILSK